MRLTIRMGKYGRGGTLLRIPFWLILLGLMAAGGVGVWLYTGRTTPDRPPTGTAGASPAPVESAPEEEDEPGTKSDKPSKADKPDRDPRKRRHCKPNCAGPFLSDLDEAALSLDGLGPIRVGMTRAEASDAAGVDLDVSDRFGDCAPARVLGDPEGIRFMLLSGVVSRIDIDDGETKTLSGIGIGSSAQEVFDTYPGRIKRVTDYYGVHQLEYTPAEAEYQQYSMLFSLGKRDNVTSFRSGLKEPVGYAEGCV